MQKSKLNNIEAINFAFNLTCYVVAPESVRQFIACQICLESDFFRSRLFIESFNFTGMKYPSCRFTLAIGKDGAFAKYADYVSCFTDFMYRHVYFGLRKIDLSSIDAYSHFLVRTKYCSSPDYIPAIKKLYHEYFKSES